MKNAITEFLQTRRSVVAKKMISNAPAEKHLDEILKCGLRVPDHSNVQPWKIIVLTGDAREKFSRLVILPAAKARAESSDDPLTEAMEALELARMQRSGAVLTVLFKPTIPHKIPLWEQQLSSGAVCSHLLIAAQSFGYAAQWLTEWPAYDASVIKALGGNPKQDLVAGFIHIGEKAEAPTERKRPDRDQIIHHWK